MNAYFFFLIFNSLIFFNKISFSVSIASKVFPIYKIALSPNLREFFKNKSYNLIIHDIKGIGVIFDNDSEISLIPEILGKYIEKYYNHFEEVMTDFIPKENGIIEIILYYYYGGSECLHFIFENYGISIPISNLLTFKDDIHTFKFRMKENQDNIVIGKDLIELLGIDLSDINNIVVNDKYMSKIEDEE